MVGRPKSESKKRQIQVKIKASLQRQAVAAYQEELAKRALGLPARGARAICDYVTAEHKQKTGTEIKFNHATIINHARGLHRPRTEHDAENGWLTLTEVELVLQYIIELGNRGFPLSHRRLKEHVDEILQAHLGDTFLAKGVGKNWTHRFIQRHSDQIKASWASPLEEKRGRAVNPHTNEAWFKLLEDTIRDYDIVPKMTYGTDEIGCSGSTGPSEHVLGANKKGPQYQQIGGDRENITVIVTICADGSATPSAVIFKGKGYQVSWKQDNPANASIGYSKKGWTNGEIGVEWIKDFDERTKTKAAGCYWLLLVDGHNSHYTRSFLQYARMHQILILCYPSHGTHVYQGLDIVVFATLKRYIREERDKWERSTGQKLKKENFLTIYRRAHMRAITPETVKAAFRKTEVWPFNPLVVTEEMMALSKETSCEGQLPLVLAMSVRVIAKMLHDLCIKDDLPDSDEEIEGVLDMESGSDSDEGDVGEGQPCVAISYPPSSHTDPAEVSTLTSTVANSADVIKEAV
ncbi:Pogo transposable element with KRAB domain [Sparassis crispa]|uniref:Pogo transposable element with KRAB domain n=1 Tax=Sparassis crispa TaxID=139825 RepID=A0A401GQR1_9APHY|nr:Pogo transposable element with KRAB domain [Sparassis crispa]GBE84500.1 Pogo transposable element with KRAB domain [Sparassis crispa]